MWTCCVAVQIYAENAREIQSLSFPSDSPSMTADWLNPLEDNIYLSAEALQSENERRNVVYYADFVIIQRIK